MKKTFMVISLAILFCFAFGCQQAEEVAEEPAVDIVAEEAAIRDTFAESDKSGPAKDVELLMSFVADDALTVSGDKEATQKWYSDYFSQGRYWDNGTIDKLEISASGDMAYMVCKWDYFNDEGQIGSGHNVMVWKKQVDGSWKMASW